MNAPGKENGTLVSSPEHIGVAWGSMLMARDPSDDFLTDDVEILESPSSRLLKSIGSY